MTVKSSHLTICRHGHREEVGHMNSDFTVLFLFYILIHIDAQREVSENREGKLDKNSSLI